jgi:hypothetical protein
MDMMSTGIMNINSTNKYRELRVLKAGKSKKKGKDE